MGAAASGRPPGQDLPVNQVGNVAQGGVLGTFGQLGPFGGGEFSLETVEQAGQNLLLPMVKGEMTDVTPKPGSGENAFEQGVCGFDGPFQAAQEPGHPGGYVGGAGLGLFQDSVVVVAFRAVCADML